MTQEIFRVNVKANFRTRAEAVSFINTAKNYLNTMVQAGKHLGVTSSAKHPKGIGRIWICHKHNQM